MYSLRIPIIPFFGKTISFKNTKSFYIIICKVMYSISPEGETKHQAPKNMLAKQTPLKKQNHDMAFRAGKTKLRNKFAK